MAKLFSNKKLILKPIISLNKSAQNINQYIDEIIENSSLNDKLKNPLSISNNNNNTIDYLNHYSPINRSPISLPPIPKNTQKFTNSQKKIQINKSNKNILFSSKKPKKLKSQDENISINNIAKLNIYIQSEGKSEEYKNYNLKTIEQNKIKTNRKKDTFYSTLFNNYKENNNSLNDTNINRNRINKKKINKIINFYSPTNNNNNISKINYQNFENNIGGDTPKIITQNSLNNENIYKKNIINEIIKEKVENEKEKINNLNNFSLPAINSSKLSNILNKSENNYSNNKLFGNNNQNKIQQEKDIDKQKNEDNKNNKEIDYGNINNIDTSLNFLKDLTTDKNKTFINFLILIQTHLDIELFFDSLKIANNMNTFRKKKIINNNLNFIAISTVKLLQLKELLNAYFNILSRIYKKNIENINNISCPIDTFFLFPMINNIFHKCLKIQICLYSIILITINQLNDYEINLLIKNYLTQLIKQISFPLLLIYENFIKDEINLKYQEILKNNLKQDFNDNFKKLFQEKKIQIKNNCNSNSQLISQLSKDLDKCIYSLQYYSSINIKNSDIKIFGDSLNQMINSIEIKPLNQFVIIFLDTLLYSELEENHKKVKTNNNNNTIYNIKEFAPFLPNLNSKYKYTLVLDMDETLVHFFFTKHKGMFFIRPYCFEFLNQLKELYEIITFTAGTKEYADYILNLLDPNNELIQYRLYRQHVTIFGCNVYKDLNKLGRDLSKVIIIDNMKDNFKMQPNNGLYVKTWINDINDYQFKDLLKILKDIVLFNVIDVRIIIGKINEKINKENNLINPYYNINIEKIVNLH